ncbi:metallophosphoesterase family protein [Bacillus capparidis]|nr:metallophosphoesterase family protein [Bacillus capparidis]
MIYNRLRERLLSEKLRKEGDEMRLAVISDIHGNAVAFQQAIQDLRDQSPDRIICLGDIAMRGPQPVECVELLQSLDPYIVVRGNYDHMFTRFPMKDWKPETFKQELALRAIEYDGERLSQEQQEWLADLPTEGLFEAEGVHVEAYHASPSSLYSVQYPWASLDDLDLLHKNEQTELVLFGHVHHAFVRQCKGRTIVNCGSIGMPFDGDNRASYAIIDIQNNDIAVQLRRVTYDIERAISIARESGMPDVKLFEYALRTAEYPYLETIANLKTV